MRVLPNQIYRMNNSRITIVFLLACYGGISICIGAKKPKNPKTLILVPAYKLDC